MPTTDLIDVGSSPNDNTGDPMRTFLQAVNTRLRDGDATTPSELRLPEATGNGTDYVAIRPAALLTANRSVTCPDRDFNLGAHASEHESGGAQAISISGLSGTAGEGQCPLTGHVWVPGDPVVLTGAAEGTRGTFKTWDFDDTADESAVLMTRTTFNSGYLTYYQVSFKWVSASATTGSVRWKAEIDSVTGARDITSDSYGTAKFATSTAPGTSGVVQAVSLLFTLAEGGSPSSNDEMRVKLTRVGSDGADTMTGDAQVISLQIEETP